MVHRQKNKHPFSFVTIYTGTIQIIFSFMDQKENQNHLSIQILTKYIVRRMTESLNFKRIIKCTFKVESKVQVFDQEKENYVVTMLTKF